MPGEKLRVVKGAAQGEEIPLDAEFQIGRSAGGQGTLGDDPELSRRHARVFRDERGELVIEDLNSTNGTFVNGQRVTGRQAIRAGDRVEMGTTTLQVLDPAGQVHQPTVFGSRPAAVPPPPPPTAPAQTPGVPLPPSAVPRTGPAPQPTEKRKSPVFLLLPVVLIGAIVAGVILLTGGDDDDEGGGTLTAQELVAQGKKETVQIDTTSPALARELGAPAQAGGGTGIVIDAAKGQVLTNEHVVSGTTSIKVHQESGGDVNAAVNGQAPCEDLAVITMKPVPKGYQTAKFGDSGTVKEGDPVTAMGYPTSFEGSSSSGENTVQRLQVTTGTITARPAASGDLGSDLPRYPQFLQHQAPINAGNSGGPLFNDKGDVIGVNTFSSASGQGQYGAIASNRVKTLVNDLKQGDTSDYVGWHLLPWQATDTGLDKGVIVLRVDSGSPADGAKLRSGVTGSESPLIGATIFELNNQPVNSVSDICDVLGSRRSGSKLVASADVTNVLRSSGGTLFAPSVAPNTGDAQSVDIGS